MFSSFQHDMNSDFLFMSLAVCGKKNIFIIYLRQWLQCFVIVYAGAVFHIILVVLFRLCFWFDLSGSCISCIFSFIKLFCVNSIPIVNDLLLSLYMFLFFLVFFRYFLNFGILTLIRCFAVTDWSFECLWPSGAFLLLYMNKVGWESDEHTNI